MLSGRRICLQPWRRDSECSGLPSCLFPLSVLQLERGGRDRDYGVIEQAPRTRGRFVLMCVACTFFVLGTHPIFPLTSSVNVAAPLESTYMPLLTRTDSRASTDSFESTVQALFSQSDDEGNMHIDETTSSASLVLATSKASVNSSHGPVSACVYSLVLACLPRVPWNGSIFCCHDTSIASLYCALTFV